MTEAAIKKSIYRREKQAGFLETLGVRYYHFLAQKAGTAELHNVSIDDLQSDATLQALAAKITTFAAVIAFAIGALTTSVTIWIEWTYQASMSTAAYYLLYGTALVLMLAIEMTVLFWLGLKTVYSLACLTGHNQAGKDFCLPGDDAVPNLLARAALEVPDPIIRYLGIDPLKHLSKSKLFMVTVLYKAKVILSTMGVKFLLVRFFGKGDIRMAFSWVAIPITALWDAFTVYKVAREARLRLFGNKLAEHIAVNIITDDVMARLSPKAREGSVRAVAVMMVLTQRYHPNMLVLLHRLCSTFEIDENKEYDNWEYFLSLLDEVADHERYFLLDLLCVASAFDGHISRLERYHLPEAFRELTEEYMQRAEKLKNMLLNGRLHAAKDLCELDFKAG